MKIAIKKLRKLCELFLDGVEYRIWKEIVFKDYFYWKINPKDQFVIYEDPILEFGSLSDEIASLKEIVKKQRKPTANDLKNLGQLFTILSGQIEKETGLILLLDKDD